MAQNGISYQCVQALHRPLLGGGKTAGEQRCTITQHTEAACGGRARRADTFLRQRIGILPYARIHVALWWMQARSQLHNRTARRHNNRLVQRRVERQPRAAPPMGTMRDWSGVTSSMRLASTVTE